MVKKQGLNTQQNIQIYPWGDSRRFNSYAAYFKRAFGKRIQKVTIDAGFTCPNRDGSLGTGGCSYCNNSSFNPSYCSPKKSITQQINEGIEFHINRYRRADKFLAYFQAYSNTYAPLEYLKKIYSEALSHPSIIGLVIGTRPDCIDSEKLDYFQMLSEKYYVVLEYGIESCYNKTLERINRCHNFECSCSAIEQTASRGINTGAHIIFGLPGETRKEMMEEVNILSKLPINSIKFHQLQILKDTKIAQEYETNPASFHIFNVEEYLEFIIDVVERLNPDIVLERIAGEVPPRYLALQVWSSLRNEQLISLFEKNLEKRNTWQGRLYRGVNNG